MRLIDADALYKRTAEWEEQAQDEVNKNKGCRTVEEWDKYREWLIILNERSSFKYDIADAPAIESEPTKHGRWKKEWSSIFHTELPACSECGRFSALEWNYCPNCGADMRGGENDSK